MKRMINLIVVGFAVMILGGCAMAPQQPQMTPLEIQAMQTHSFKASKRKAFNATMQVFQDLGYTVKSANYDTGFISAQGMTQKAESHAQGFMKFVEVVNSMQDNRNVSRSDLTKATAFISETSNKKARIRLSFVNELSTSVNGGNPNQNDTQILDGKIYTKMFNRIGQALFVGTA